MKNKYGFGAVWPDDKVGPALATERIARGMAQSYIMIDVLSWK
jgi:hypothetical protein